MQDCTDLLVNKFGQYYDGDHGRVFYTFLEQQSDINAVASKIDILSKLLLLACWDRLIVPKRTIVPDTDDIPAF